MRSITRKATDVSKSYGKIFFIGAMCIILVASFLALTGNLPFVLPLFFAGLTVICRCIMFLGDNRIERARQEEALLARQDRGQTILVQLVDDNGIPLPFDIAQARLTTAQRQAGPRDTVIGVHHK